jgi:hypothetical protein
MENDLIGKAWPVAWNKRRFNALPRPIVMRHDRSAMRKVHLALRCTHSVCHFDPAQVHVDFRLFAKATTRLVGMRVRRKHEHSTTGNATGANCGGTNKLDLRLQRGPSNAVKSSFCSTMTKARHTHDLIGFYFNTQSV